MKKVLKLCFAFLIVFASLGVQGDKIKIEAAATDSFQYIGKVKTIKVTNNNKVDIITDKDEKIRITFLNENIFRLNMEMGSANFLDKPEPNSPKHTAEMLVKHESDYPGANISIQENETYYSILSKKVELRIQKADSRMSLINRETNIVVWDEKEPLKYKNNKTIQTLKTDDNEYFYGGGMQNGYFSHKGTSINIVKNPNKWVDGYAASPTPFYISTKGYGAMRYTWKEGTYDFGKTDASTVSTEHNETRFDAFYFVEPNNPVLGTMQDYLDMTGSPYLMPEYAWYLGHLNCYSRDTWKQTNSGKPLYDIKGTNWKEDKNGDVTEKLNGAEGPTAQNILDMYTDNDIPVGMMLPNDGYGCGYGRTGSLEENIKNLGQFSNYANNKGVETGLWTQSALTPEESASAIPDLQRDLANEAKIGGVRALKTDVAWVGPGYSMALHAVATASKMIEDNSNYRSHIISLDGWNGTQRYAAIWSGDQTGGNWEYIRFHIPTYIGSGLSGLPNVASDQNGIWGQDPIISTRDYQWKAFTPIQLDMDGWAQEVKMPTYYKQNAEINRFYLKLKAEMLPYNYSNGWEATSTGMPMLRAMLLEYPNDPYTYGTGTQYQYMWGKNLLIAPVYQNVKSDAAGNDVRNGIYLPDENQVWIDYFSGKQYKGGSIINNYDTPIWKQPVFVKNGAIIPMTEENNSPKDIKKDATRIFDVYPSGKTDFTMYEDDGQSKEYRNGGYATTLITSDAPKEGTGTATITVNKPKGDYAATNKAAQRATQFNVSVQSKPSDVKLLVGGKEVTIKEVSSMEEFNKSDKDVMYYDNAPDLNKYSHLGNGNTELGKIVTTPKVFVKTAKNVDITKQEVKVIINGFNNTASLEDDGSTQVPATPTNIRKNDAQTSDKQISFSWDASEQATSYDVMIDGKTPINSNITDLTYVLKGLDQDSEHSIQVRATNSKGSSAWSEAFFAKTKVDQYKNVPKNMSVSYVGDSEPAAYTGKLAYMVDGLNSTEYSSKDSGAWTNKAFEIDMKKAYHLEKVEYDYRKDAGNGAVKKFELKYSIDGLTWNTLSWNINIQNEPVITPDEGEAYRRATLTFDTPIDARYMNFTVKDSYGGFLQSYEIRPYALEGTTGFLPGDYNENGVIDEGDLEFLKNYSGRTLGDRDWDYAGKADINKNNVIDAFDVVYVSSKLGKPLASTNLESSGAITIVPNKMSASKGEEITYSVYGSNFNDVNAFYLQTIFDNKYSFVSDSIQPGSSDLHMINFSKLAEESNRVNIIFANKGENKKLSGSDVLATFKLKAEDNIADTSLAIDKAFIVGSDMKQKNANTSDNTENTQPSIEDVKLKLDDIKDISFDNDVKANIDPSVLWQQSNWKQLLFDGDTSKTLAEFKWFLPTLTETFPQEVKLPTNMNFTFKKEETLKSIKVYNRGSSNGRILSMKATGYLGGTVTDLGTIDTAMNVFTFQVPKGKHFDKVVITPLTSNGTATGIKNGSEKNRMLSVYEIEFYSNNTVPLEKIAFKEEQAKVSIGRNMPLDIVFTPENTSFKNVTIESSDPNIAKIEKTVDANGIASYYVRGMKAGEVTLTATSISNHELKAQITLTVVSTKDKEKLESLINEVSGYPKDVYNEASFKTLELRLDEAKTILAKENSTQEDLDTALINLLKAKLNLEYRDVRTNEKIPTVLGETTLVKATAQYYADSNVPERAIDNDKSTFWESPYSGVNAGLPKDICLELIDIANVDQLDFTPVSRNNGAVTEFKVYTSLDGNTWDEATHVYVDSTRYTVDKNFDPVQAIFAARDAKFVKFEALSALDSNGQPGAKYADVAELQVYGRFAAKEIQLNVDKEVIIVDESTTIMPTVMPTYTTYKDVIFTSSDASVASVDEHGVVIGHKKGEVEIGVESKQNPEINAKLKITIDPLKYLSEAIEKALTYTDATKYTPTSWSTFTTALSEAQAIVNEINGLKRAPITQNAINKATNNLNTAMDNLVEMTTKDKLDALVEEMETFVSENKDTDYTKDSWKNLVDAIESGKQAVSDEEVSNAFNTLTDAKNNLVNIKELSDAIKDLNEIQGTYSQASIDAYNDVIQKAKDTLVKENATQEEVDQALRNVQQAKSLLIDVSALNDKIKETQDQLDANREKYTTTYVQQLEEAIKKATQEKNTLLTQEALNNAIGALEIVRGNQVYRGDNTELQKLIDSSEIQDITSNKDKYTSASYAQFKTALDYAKQVVANKDATQDEINQAISNLKTYQKALEFVKDTNSPTLDNKPGTDVRTSDTTNLTLLFLTLLLSASIGIYTYKRRSKVH